MYKTFVILKSEYDNHCQLGTSFYVSIPQPPHIYI